MPCSWYQAIPAIIDLVLLDKPQSILDLGAGFGKYGVLLREAGDIPYERYDRNNWGLVIDGVEGFRSYKNPLHEYVYNEMIYGDVLTVVKSMVKEYDTVLLIDVLEHLDKESGYELIDEILQITNRSLIISTPIQWVEQGAYLGNELEVHRSSWSMVDFADYDYQFSQVKIGNNGANLFKLYPTVIQRKALATVKPLKLAYFLPHHNLTGGLKMLLSQMDAMRKRGHYITALYKGEEGDFVLPSWCRIEVDEEILIPHNQLARDYADDCDVIVAGWIQQVLELKGAKAKVVYWEQGHEWLFGDVRNSQQIDLIRRQMETYYTSGVDVMSVSRFVERVLMARYNLQTTVIPNGIDTTLYCPPAQRNEEEPVTVLLIGNPTLSFKNFPTAINVLQILWERGYKFQVNWVSQVRPETNVGFPLKIIVHPSEEVLISYYQQADIFLYTSWYEGFGMPPLEAMACETAVVATKCGGIDDYAVHDFNSLLAEPEDEEKLIVHMESLLMNEERREYLAVNGRKTAVDYNYERVIPKLEDYLLSLLGSKVSP